MILDLYKFSQKNKNRDRVLAKFSKVLYFNKIRNILRSKRKQSSAQIFFSFVLRHFRVLGTNEGGSVCLYPCVVAFAVVYYMIQCSYVKV